MGEFKFSNLDNVAPQNGRRQGENGLVVNVVDTGVDVNIQDQTSDTIDYFMCIHIADLALAADAVTDEYTLSLVDGSGVANGSYVCLQEDRRAFQAKILSGGGTNTITLDTPLDYPFTAAGVAIANRSPELNVDGSVTPVIAKLNPIPGVKWDVTRIIGAILTAFASGSPADSKFGGEPALTRGIVVRKSDGIHHTIFNAKTNGDIKLRTGPSDVQYTTATANVSYGTGFRRTFNGQDKNGVAIRIDGDLGEELQIIIQDDLTDLLSFRVVVQGHVVDDPVSII